MQTEFSKLLRIHCEVPQCIGDGSSHGQEALK
jgi:hypothetical protein